MSQGIRAELQVDPAGTCAVLTAAREAGAPAHLVGTAPADAPGRVVEEFTLEGVDEVPATDLDIRRVFRYGTATVFRLTRDRDAGGPRSVVESVDTPVVDLRTHQGMVRLVFHAADMATLQQVMAALQDAFPTVDVQRLLRSEHDRPDDALLFVDRSTLTDRQREVLEVAHRMGYFDHPKGANAGEVADALDISRSTLSEHLAAGQSKLFDAILEP